jgi:hypothetical protein
LEERKDAVNEQRIIDPGSETLQAKLAGGYNDFTAKHYMKAIEQIIPEEKLKEAADYVYGMMTWKTDLDLENGKVTREQVDNWFNSPYYVPLTGDPSVDVSEDELFQHGGLDQAKDKTAKGRLTSTAQNGIDAAIEQVQKSARYHGWVDFKDKLTEIYDDLIQRELDDGLTMQEAQRAIFDKYRS